MKHNLARNSMRIIMDDLLDDIEGDEDWSFTGFVEVDKTPVVKDARVFDFYRAKQVEFSLNRGFSFDERPWMEFSEAQSLKFSIPQLAEFSVYVYSNYKSFNYKYDQIYPDDVVTSYVKRDMQLSSEVRSLFLAICDSRQESKAIYQLRPNYDPKFFNCEKKLRVLNSYEFGSYYLESIYYDLLGVTDLADKFYGKKSVSNERNLLSFLANNDLDISDVEKLVSMSFSQVVVWYRDVLFNEYWASDDLIIDYVVRHSEVRYLTLIYEYLGNHNHIDDILFVEEKSNSHCVEVEPIVFSDLSLIELQTDTMHYVSLSRPCEGPYQEASYSIELGTKLITNDTIKVKYYDRSGEMGDAKLLSVIFNDNELSLESKVKKSFELVSPCSFSEVIGVLQRLGPSMYYVDVLYLDSVNYLVRVNPEFMFSLRGTTGVIDNCYVKTVTDFVSCIVPVYCFRFKDSSFVYYWSGYHRNYRDKLVKFLGYNYVESKYKEALRRLLFREEFYVGCYTYIFDSLGNIIGTYYLEIPESYCHQSIMRFWDNITSIASADYDVSGHYLGYKGYEISCYNGFQVVSEFGEDKEFFVFTMDWNLYTKVLKYYSKVLNYGSFNSSFKFTFLSRDEALLRLKILKYLIERDKEDKGDLLLSTWLSLVGLG